MDVVKVADHVVDLGPDGGQGGGRILFSGTPEALAAADTHTSRYLRDELERTRAQAQADADADEDVDLDRFADDDDDTGGDGYDDAADAEDVEDEIDAEDLEEETA
jgi:excinuclease ABC subunit A